MISVKNVSKTFVDTKALDGLNINVKKGTVYGLIGPNGAGKTTIIKHLTGTYRQDFGEITIGGENVYENLSVKAKTVLIGDDLYFFPSYTILDMARYYKSIYPNWDESRFLALKNVFKIDLKRRVKRLSKGMQKQVAFWLGISAKPDVLILDEPVDGLDPVMRRNVWKLMLSDVCEREMTVLVSSHNLRELEDVCDHVGIMHAGKIVLEKSLDDAKGNIHKIQVAFADDSEDKLSEELNIIHREKFGSVLSLIIKGEIDEIKEKIMAKNPLLCDVLPLTLEEVFIYELGGIGYETADIII